MDVRRRSEFIGYVAAVVGVLVATAVLLPLRPYLQSPVFMLLFVPVIIAIARPYGVRASATAAVLAFIVLDLLFIPPYYRLVIASVAEWIALVVFLIVALVSGSQTAALRKREQAAVRRREELELLNRLSFRVASENSPRSTAEFIVRQAMTVLGAKRAAIYSWSPGTATATRLAQAGETGVSENEAAFVEWVLHSNKGIGLSSHRIASDELLPPSVAPGEPLPGLVATGVYIPLQTSDSLEGVLHAVLPRGHDHEDADHRLLVAAANLAAASLERHRLESDAARAVALAEADRLKSTFVSSVSHELKTPLAAATARVTGLLEEDTWEADRVRDELVAVADDLTRLDASIGDLLDVSLLESDSWRPRVNEHDMSDVLGTVLSRLPTTVRARVCFELPDSLPPACVDFAQIVRAMTNLVENALVYSPPEAPVTIGARAVGGELHTWVSDRGPGVSAREKERVFEKFYRGTASQAAPLGTGLGLAIAHEVVRNHGGRIWIEDVQGGGAKFVVSLPLSDTCGAKGESRGDA